MADPLVLITGATGFIVQVAADQPILCPFPLVIDEKAWVAVARVAERLAAETELAERELLARPDLQTGLALPRRLQRALARARSAPAPAAVRTTRFDFHWTTEGWRISEANTDVASGFIESSGVSRLFSAEQPALRPTGDPAGCLADGLAGVLGPGARVGLMHLTRFTDDRQVILYLARRFTERGLTPCAFDPSQLRAQRGRAVVETDRGATTLDGLFRFFPADWLPRLSRRSGWPQLFTGTETPASNPAWTILSQSKRFPLTWSKLETPMKTWTRLLPETRAPDAPDVDREDDWVVKPALGHEGRDVAIAGAVDPEAARRIWRAARLEPDEWVAQRRFRVVPLPTPEGILYPSLGVFVIGGRVAGAYARAATRPLIDPRARELIVLVSPRSPAGEGA